MIRRKKNAYSKFLFCWSIHLFVVVVFFDFHRNFVITHSEYVNGKAGVSDAAFDWTAAYRRTGDAMYGLGAYANGAAA